MWSFDRWPAILLALPVLLIAGCGFQARSSIALPESLGSVYLDAGDRYTEFYKELTQTLRRRGLQLAPAADAADLVIRIERDESNEEIVSVSPQNKPREMNIYYLVSYAALVDGEPVLETQSIIARRNYNFDETQVLGKALEARSLREALARDLVGRVMRRLSTLD